MTQDGSTRDRQHVGDAGLAHVTSGLRPAQVDPHHRRLQFELGTVECQHQRHHEDANSKERPRGQTIQIS